MPRDVDSRKKRKALRKLRKAAELAAQGLGPPLSDWEKQFLEEVEERIETYGSAFADLEKGGRDEALSALQSQKLREIDRKARGKTGGGFRRKRPMNQDRHRPDEHETPSDSAEDEALQTAPEPRKTGRPALRLVKSDRRPD